MTKYVIDTNVPIVANGDHPAASIQCRISAVTTLQNALSKGTIYLDFAGVIQEQYRKYLKPSGQPGVGDRFYQEVLNSHPDRVQRVALASREDGEYFDLPQAIIDAGFDPSDRVFAAVAHKTGAIVHNAVDSDWLEKREVIEANDIDICFVCGDDPSVW